MIDLNVSFGIFAFMPQGWLFMAAVVVLECWLMSKYLAKCNFDTSVCASVCFANAVSGIIGLVLSMILNGGWWLVVWMPWISNHELNFHYGRAVLFFAVYYLIAFLLSIVIEGLINCLCLSKHFMVKQVVVATIKANLWSYLLGSVVLYVISFLLI